MTDEHATDHDAADADNPVRWVAPAEADTDDLLDRPREIAQARARALGTTLDDKPFMVLVDEASQLLGNATAGGGTTASELMRRDAMDMRDSRLALREETCPACGTTPRWADDGVFGSYSCSATSTSRVGTLTPMTHEQRAAAAELAAAHGGQDVATVLREAEQPELPDTDTGVLEQLALHEVAVEAGTPDRMTLRLDNREVLAAGAAGTPLPTWAVTSCSSTSPTGA